CECKIPYILASDGKNCEKITCHHSDNCSSFQATECINSECTCKYGYKLNLASNICERIVPTSDSLGVTLGSSIGSVSGGSGNHFTGEVHSKTAPRANEEKWPQRCIFPYLCCQQKCCSANNSPTTTANQ